MASFTSDRDDVLNMIVTSTASVSRKRKREDERSVLGDSFVIKVTPSSPLWVTLNLYYFRLLNMV